MNSGLNEACAVLDDFEKEVARIKADWEQIAADNPSFEQVSSESWQEKRYRMWLHGATNVWECNELERWLTDYPPSMALANSSAKEMHATWRKSLLTAGPSVVIMIPDYDKKSGNYVERESHEPSEAFYAEHDKFEIQEPTKGETLYNFIVRLARSFEDQHDEHRKNVRKKRKHGDWLEER